MDILDILDNLPCDGFVGTLTVLEYFQPNSPDFNLVHTLRLEVGFGLPFKEVVCFLGPDFLSSWLLLTDGLSEKLSFLDVLFEVPANLFSLT